MATVVADASMYVEVSASLDSPPIYIEWTRNLSADSFALAENTATAGNLINNSAAPFEIQVDARIDQKLSIEVPASILTHANNPAEQSSVAGRGHKTQVEFAGGVQKLSLQVEFGSGASSDGRTPVEGLRGLRAEPPVPAETSGTIIGNAGAPVENTGTIIVTLDEFLPIEGNAKQQFDARVGAEAILAQQSNSGHMLESAVSIQIDTIFRIDALLSATVHLALWGEFVASWRADHTISTESTGTATFSVLGDNNADVEWSGTTRSDGVAAAESIGSIRADLRTLIEAMITAGSDSAAGLEGSLLSRLDAAVPTETLGQAIVAVDTLLALETSGALRVDLSALGELLTGAAVNVSAASESLSSAAQDARLAAGSTVRLLSQAGLNDEMATALIADAGGVNAEWQALIADVLADAGIPIEALQLSDLPLASVGRLLRTIQKRRLIRATPEGQS